MYKVIKRFADLQDSDYIYDPADDSCNTYPRKGLKVSDERIAELSGKDNKQGAPLIEKIEKKADDKKADDKKADEKKATAEK